MRQIGLQLIVDDSQKSKFSGIATAAQRAMDDLNGRFDVSPVVKYEQALNRLGTSATILGAVAFRALAGGVSGLVGEFKKLGQEFISINEKFGNLEITLGSALRSFKASRDIVKELANITARSPLPFQDLANITQSLAVIPQTSQRLLQQAQAGKLSQKDGYLQRAIQTVEAMNTFRPDQGADSAIFAIREALGGQLRSLIRRFDIPSKLLNQTSGKSTAELVAKPDLLIETIRKVFTDIISPEAIASSARQPTKLIQNFKEQALDLPLLRLGQTDQLTQRSPYQAALVSVQKVFDELVDFMQSSFEKRFAPKLRDALSEASERVFGAGGNIAAKLLDKLGVAGNGAGIERIVTGVTDGILKSADFFSSLAEKVDKNDLIPKLIDIVSGFLTVIEKVVKFFVGIGTVFGPTVGAFAAFASPAILSNLGTITRFLGDTLPKALYSLSNALFSDKSKAIDLLANSGGGSLKTQGNSLPVGLQLLMGNKSGAYSGVGPTTAAFIRAPGGSNRGEYRDAALNNPLYLAALNEQYGGTAAPTIAARNQRIRREQDATYNLYNSDPERFERLSARRGSNIGVGASMAARGEAEALMAANSKPSLLGSLGRAAGGVALGALTSFGVAALAAGVVYGTEKLVEALRENTVAQREVAEGKSKIEDKVNRQLLSPDLVALSKLVGIDPYSSASGKVGSLRKLGDIGASFSLDKLGKDAVNPKVGAADNFFTAMGQIDINGEPGMGRSARADKVYAEAASAQNRANQLTAVSNLGVDTDTFASLVKTSVQAGLFKQDFADVLSKKFVEEPIMAVKSLFATIDVFPDGRDRLKATVEDNIASLVAANRDAIYTKLKKDYGPLSDLLKGVAAGTVNPKNENDIRKALFDASGTQNVLANAELSKTITSSSVVTGAQTNLEAYYKKTYSSDAIIEDAQALETARKGIADKLANLNEDFAKAAGNYEELKKRLLNDKSLGDTPQFADLRKTMQTLIDDPEKSDQQRFAALKTLVADRQRAVSDTGEAFTAGLTNVLLSTEKLLGLVGKTSEAEFSRITSEINAQLKILDPNGTLAPRLNIRAPQDASKVTLDERSRQLGAAYGGLSQFTSGLSGLGIFKGASLDTENGRLGKAFGGFNKENITPAQLEADAKIAASKNAFFVNASRSGTYSAISAGGAGLTGALSAAGGVASTSNAAAQRNLFPILAGGTQLDMLKRENSLLEAGLSILKTQGGSAEDILQTQMAIEDVLAKQNDILTSMDPQSFLTGLAEGLSTAREELYNFAQAGKEIGDTIKSSFSDAFASLISGTMNARQAFNSMVGSISQMLIKLLAQKAVQMFFNWAISAYAGTANTSAGMASAGAPSALAARSGLATGGIVAGGSGLRDDVPAMLTGGEFVINRRAAQMIGYGNLHAMNSGGMPGYAAGGSVGMPAYSGGSPANWGGGGSNVTVNVNYHSGQESSRDSQGGGGAPDESALKEMNREIEAKVLETITKYERRKRIGI